jgi:hypothetical protein
MQNEIRYYMSILLDKIGKKIDDTEDIFDPSYIITAVKLPTGAIEIAVNDKLIKEKLEYILEAYDDDMHLHANKDVVLVNLMVV